MRLVCPNCDAEYEVDAAAIPLTGRDVQCSNCGHAWFQAHPDVGTEEGEGDIFDAPRVAAAPVAAETVAEGPVKAGPADAGPASAESVAALTVPARPPVPSPAPVLQTLDDTVLAVLREEAEREAAARRAEAAVAAKTPVIETQTEMPLAQDQSAMTAAVRRVARLRGAEPDPVPPPPPPRSRREMLPAIEEINSTLRATNDRSSDADAAISDTMAEPGPAPGSFRRGFLTLVLLVVVLVLLYVVAPLIGSRVPALADYALGYHAAVDAARLWLDVELRALISALRGLAGSKGG